MKIIEKEGKSTSKIINEFIKEFNVTLDDFKFEVIEEGSSGFLNLFGAKPTKIRFLLPDVSDKIKEYTEGILRKMFVEYNDIKVSFKDNTYSVSITGTKDPGFIIGKDAKLLDSVQHLLNQMINKYEKKQLRLRLDVDGYRNRKREALIGKVKSISEKVKQRGRSITLEPLHAANRRLVHQFIEKDSTVKTMTIGEGEFKRVVIMPANRRNDRHGKRKTANSDR